MMTIPEARAVIRRLYDERVACGKLHEVLEILDTAEDRLARLQSAIALRDKELSVITESIGVTQVGHDEVVRKRVAEIDELIAQKNLAQAACGVAKHDLAQAESARENGLAKIGQYYTELEQEWVKKVAVTRAKLDEDIQRLRAQYDETVKAIRELGSKV